MTIFLTALTNDNAKLIVKQARFCNDERTADIVMGMWESEGFIVIKEEDK